MKRVRLPVWIFLFLGLVLFAALMMPPIRCGIWPSHLFTKNDVVQIVNAVGNFYADYGYLPKVTENGFCETAESNARLIKILEGEDSKGNPRQIQYLQVPKGLEKNGIYRKGIHPETGAWVDYWGNFYRVRLATQERRIPNPYNDDKPRYLEADAITWSVGKDGIQGRKGHPQTKNGSDDITSWETN